MNRSPGASSSRKVERARIRAGLVIGSLFGVLLVGAAGAGAFASIPDADGLIHACVKHEDLNRYEQMRWSTTGKCRGREKVITWNAQGPQGIQGKQGIQGEKGKQGIQGEKGKDGIDGKDGTDGTNGTNGTNGKDSTVPGPPGPAGASKSYFKHTVGAALGNVLTMHLPEGAYLLFASITAENQDIGAAADPGSIDCYIPGASGSEYLPANDGLVVTGDDNSPYKGSISLQSWTATPAGGADISVNCGHGGGEGKVRAIDVALTALKVDTVETP